MEQLAANAERASIKYKQVEFMADHLGEVFEGMISGVTEWGLYVELDDNKCEGLVPIRDLANDYYDFDEKNYCIVGRRNNIRFRLGDKVKVQVAKANMDRKQLDFKLVDERLANKDEDLMGRKISVAQALSNSSSKKKSKSKEKTRSRKKANR